MRDQDGPPGLGVGQIKRILARTDFSALPEILIEEHLNKQVKAKAKKNKAARIAESRTDWEGKYSFSKLRHISV